jgi:hypothetical protein
MVVCNTVGRRFCAYSPWWSFAGEWGGALSGCDVLDFLEHFHVSSSNKARAQQDEMLVETFLLRAGSFGINSDVIIEFGTQVEVRDEVPIYKQIDGSLSFIPPNCGSREFRERAVEDIVIERPGLNQVTHIRKSN